mmetsp:Transcript_75181/g.195940  ORF Transcript_75181/g.195940 Transcript_75181/m.195940 type:complete len:251 (+) Transcript_75181:498-1250(+)
MALQPLLQNSTSTPAALTARTSSCQKPASGERTSHQLRSSPGCSLSGSQPPNVISLSSPSSSEEARNTANVLSAREGPPQAPPDAAVSRKLNSGVCERAGSPRPRIPSKSKSANGSSVMSLATTSLSCVQPLVPPGGGSAPEPAPTRPPVAPAPSVRVRLPPRHTRSSMKTPVTSPVPNARVIWSRAWPGPTTVPSTSMSFAAGDALRLYRRCFLHVGARHSMDGITRCPEPVSNTTWNACAGSPMDTGP